VAKDTTADIAIINIMDSFFMGLDNKDKIVEMSYLRHKFSIILRILGDLSFETYKVLNFSILTFVIFLSPV